MNHIPEEPDMTLEDWIKQRNQEIPVQQIKPSTGAGLVWYFAITLLILLALLVWPRGSDAQTLPRNAVKLTWTNATQNTDGTAVPTTCPSGQALCGKHVRTLIEYGTCNGAAFGTRVGDMFVAAPGAEAVVSGLVVQTYCFRAFHQTDYGVSSDPSNVITRAIPPPTPKPPLLAIDTVAYEIKPNSTGALVATRIGLVPMGTSCSDRQQKVGTVTYSLVPREAVDVVNWPANVKLQDVWAKCG